MTTPVDFESRENESAVFEHPLGGRIVILGETDVTTYRGKTQIPSTETFLDVLVVRGGRKRTVRIHPDQFEEWLTMLGGGAEPDDWKKRGSGWSQRNHNDWRGETFTTTTEARRQSRVITHEDDETPDYLTNTSGGMKDECPEDSCSFATWSAHGMNTHVRAKHC